MKIASWFFAFLLGGLLFYASRQISPPGDATSNLSAHVSSRYSRQAEAETGIRSKTGAVLADYRGFDLLAVGSLFSAAALVLLLFLPGAPRLAVLFPTLLGVGGAALALGVGFLSLFYGSNFLDYETLALWVGPSQGRVDGGLILTGGVLLSLGGLLLLFIRWTQIPEDARGR